MVSAALSFGLSYFPPRRRFQQKQARQLSFAVTTPLVKMRLERSAERDKREIKIIIPLFMRRAKRSAF